MANIYSHRQITAFKPGLQHGRHACKATSLCCIALCPAIKRCKARVINSKTSQAGPAKRRALPDYGKTWFLYHYYVKRAK